MTITTSSTFSISLPKKLLNPGIKTTADILESVYRSYNAHQFYSTIFTANAKDRI